MKRKISWGTFSIGFLLLAFLFSVNIGRTFCLGDIVLKLFGLKAFSLGNRQGFHFTIFYSLGMLAAGYIVGRIFPKDFGATIGRRVCAVIGLLLVGMVVMTTPVLKL